MIDETKLDTYGKALLRMGVLAYGLTADREWAAIQLANADEAGSARRSYVRVTLSFIEGMTNGIGDLLVAAYLDKYIDLEVPDFFILREIQFELDDKAKVRTKKHPVHIKQKVRFLLTLLGRLASPPLETSFDNDGWKAFGDAIAIRNRVTHPCSKEDLWVTETDINRIDTAIRWFEDETAKFLVSFKPPRKHITNQL
jgi:hypothetical protein